MPSVNETLRARAVSHAIYLERYKTQVIRDVIVALDDVDQDLVRLIRARGPDGTMTTERLNKLLDRVREMNRRSYARWHMDLNNTLKLLADYEAGFQLNTLQATIPDAVLADLSLVAPTGNQVIAAARSAPLNGRLLREWADGLEQGKYVGVRDALRIGVIEGETTQQIVTRIRGRQANNFRDGVMAIHRRHAETVVRTAVNHVANYSRELVYKQNSNVVKAVQWVSTLDDRTTEICASRDGKTWPVDEGPRPPAHMRCRSTTVPVLKSWSELGLDGSKIPEGTRASMNGQVPAKQTYGEWLRNQPASVQDTVLGRQKGQLFRRGGMTIDRFVDRTGRSYTLDELRKMDSAAFERAGL